MKGFLVKKIDMEDLRHLNLFEKITKCRATSCFEYNNIVFFCVRKKDLYKSIGKNAENLKKISKILSKRVKVIKEIKDLNKIRDFIESIVSPITFREIKVKGNEIILSASRENNSMLIGRNKKKLFEMQKIIKNLFNKDFKII